MISDSTFGTLKALYHTFGCKLNFSETSTVAREFAARGIRRVSLGEQPDIVVVNTCSVTEMADPLAAPPLSQGCNRGDRMLRTAQALGGGIP